RDLPPPDPATIAPLLDELQTLLAHNDARAITLLEQNDHTLRAALGSGFHELSGSIRRFEFDAAAALLAESRRVPG
ncbi:MAG: hypothetical protein NDI88_14070, partial [Lysobacter sp.]|nr:hypothetical protein [Lysobacter sp.]